MDLVKKYGPIAGGLSIGQYCPPACFELAGKRLELVLDTGEDTGGAVLNFLDETQLEWSIRDGGEAKAEKYECRKADDRTYLVTYCLDGVTPRENHTWVIDKEQSLVTFLRCRLGENPYWPYLIESHFTFGYIREEGKDHPDRKRHGFTEEVAGTGVKWTYGHELATVHVYYSPHWYRITYPKGAAASKQAVDTNNNFNEMMKALPGSDEPAYYVKIKESIYLISVTEQNMEKILGEKAGFRSDTLCFLDNWKHLYSVGRGFGTTTLGGEEREIFVMIGKYGAPEDVDAHFFTDPNPYLV
ncbi:Molybdenum cofactor biosynthesis protein F [Sporobacter termitidis DSM 10068]|uniref:Molybdenum cofactor biosynthesis protein F n=1 Tax=Sporobacter termitidis DSM 10068 TaxID=1123282 RepID=A0A1M5YN17_9FIRM|nr:MoaF N-terminal domain-containing protein [Sporobacter termitidis]SHI13309.1 Molybdenum cofactor biosynthesis protein F [Sporobacter termitidis DSM 10068]